MAAYLVFLVLSLVLAIAVPGPALAATEKVTVPSVSKTVTGPSTVSVGSSVTYRVHITAPSNLEDFERYPLLLTDVPARGLTVDKDSVEVRLEDGQGNSREMGEGYSLIPCANGITVSFDDLKAAGLGPEGSVTVTYRGSSDIAGTYENLAYALYPAKSGDLATEKTCDSAVEATFTAPLTAAPIAEARGEGGSGMRRTAVVKTDDIDWALPAVASCAGAAVTATAVLLVVLLEKRGRRG